MGQSFEERPRGGRLVKNLEIFWTKNNKIIIEFSFRFNDRFLRVKFKPYIKQLRNTHAQKKWPNLAACRFLLEGKKLFSYWICNQNI